MERSRKIFFEITMHFANVEENSRMFPAFLDGKRGYEFVLRHRL